MKNKIDYKRFGVFNVYIVVILSSLVCLILLDYNKNILSVSGYSEFYLFLNLTAFNNYFLLGIPDLIIKDNKIKIEEVFGVTLLIGCIISILFFISYYFIIDSKANSLRIMLYSILNTPFFIIIIINRLFLEKKLKQINSNFIKGIQNILLHSIPIFVTIFAIQYSFYGYILVGFNILIILFFRLEIVFSKIYKTTDTYKSLKENSWDGLKINLIWIFTVIIPVIDKTVINKLGIESDIYALIILSELLSRGAIIYGTIGQYYYPIYTKNVSKIQEILIKNIVVYGIIMFLGFTLFYLVKPYLSIYLGNKSLIFILLSNFKVFIYIFFILIFSGISSLCIRPLFIIGKTTPILYVYSFSILSTVLFYVIFKKIDINIFLGFTLCRTIIECISIISIFKTYGKRTDN